MNRPYGLSLDGCLAVEVGGVAFEVQAQDSTVDVNLPSASALITVVRSLPPGTLPEASRVGQLLKEVGLTVNVNVAGRSVARTGAEVEGPSQHGLLAGVQVDLWQALQSVLRPASR